MECGVCHQEIKSGEYILWGTPVMFNGPEDGAVSFIESLQLTDIGIHTSCLESPVEAARTPNTATPEPVWDEPVVESTEEESIVCRSDALSILNL